MRRWPCTMLTPGVGSSVIATIIKSDIKFSLSKWYWYVVISLSLKLFFWLIVAFPAVMVSISLIIASARDEIGSYWDNSAKFSCRASLFGDYLKDNTADHNTRSHVLYTLQQLWVGSVTSPANWYWENAGYRAYGLSTLTEKTRVSNYSQMS